MKIACKFARGFDIMETVGQGRLAERPNAAVLKTVDGQLSGGSNPSPSAIHQAAGHNSAPPLGVYMGGDEGFEGRQAKFVPFHAQILRRSASSNLPTRSALWAVDRARRPRRESLTHWQSSYANASCCSNIDVPFCVAKSEGRKNPRGVRPDRGFCYYPFSCVL